MRGRIKNWKIEEWWSWRLVEEGEENRGDDGGIVQLKTWMKTCNEWMRSLKKKIEADIEQRPYKEMGKVWEEEDDLVS